MIHFSVGFFAGFAFFMLLFLAFGLGAVYQERLDEKK
jgi:hypothetical protein